MNNSLYNNNIFPLSIATGQAFCNRVTETNQLKLCIEQGRPVLLVSARRYGKTSLALHAIEQTGIPFSQIDFFSAVDEEDIEKAILKGVGKLISRMESIPKRALALANEIFDGSQIRVSLSAIELSIEVRERHEKPSYYVLEILQRLEKLAIKKKKKIILFFDEFQCIAEITPNRAMESVLRQVAQLTQSISFVFSGSNRHLLHELFEDRNRPFYKLCERISIDRIGETDYIPHIQKAALKTWSEKLDVNALERLFFFTERHPYYVNLLCSRLLREKKLPLSADVEKLWCQYLFEERSNVASELELLSKNQKKLLTVLSRGNGTNRPLSNAFIQKANMSKTSIDQAITFLEKKDYVYRDQLGYFRVLDPLIKAVMSA